MSFLTKSTPSLPPWPVLLVDDEPDIHDVTKLALSRFKLDGRGLSFLHAYSGEQACSILREHPEVALVFLDVVMEFEDSGLRVARWIREELGNRMLRIVLRTGQPGQAPEEKVVVEYDINDYKEKTELDRKKLFTTVFAALRAYRDLFELEQARLFQQRYREGLERVITASAHVFDQRSMRDFASGLLQQVLSLLHLNEHSMLVGVRGVSALSDETNYEILASIGMPIDANEVIEPEVLQLLERAREQQAGLFEGDTYVGYFPTRGGKVALLVLQGVKEFDEIDAKHLQIFASNVSIAFENLLLNQELYNTQGELIHRLGDVVESRSHEAGNHVRRMAELCYVLGKACGLSDEEAHILKLAAPMHDVGKIATPDAVLLKPGKLNEAEWAIMRRHPEIGHHILAGSQRPILQASAQIALQHHERYDGQGYPGGLQGEAIHLYARIVAVADVFDALSHSRCYKEAWPMLEVIKHLNAAKGNHLDPQIVDLLIENIDQAIAINVRYP